MTSQCGKATFCDKELHSLNPPEGSATLREKKGLRIVKKRTKHAITSMNLLKKDLRNLPLAKLVIA
ncbi:hypothetical protein A0W68_03805 [Campylobacter jejuni]|nr:hypothetical protein A0W68_03805 [Campylobacter jejuni]